MLRIILVSLLISLTHGATWKPTSWEHCRTNSDCPNIKQQCCSITPSLGKRQAMFPVFVKYCLPYKVETAPWCELRLQYNSTTPNYHGLCPCAPGLRCSPSTELNNDHYPRERFGKCKPIA
ncbi:hypothetical protein LOTGIDRAFT_157492 [Lottia gigantea]|uniref:Prokineticin domain-containing protein n=1 Tax=Lottia gigantea TaxID=225164 RepID=V4ABD8_LOTGI|nr:hypothetical protein LOTGIDRAFT_157492 [Lottia gigantea]ESP01314.1 hypothetical protein LOTGIDRAFT_157492 [Lottia gigantea]